MIMVTHATSQAPFTVDVWVSAHTDCLLYPCPDDTICDGDVTNIELQSNNHPTHPIQFDYTLTYNSDSITVTNMNADRSEYFTGETISMSS